MIEVSQNENLIELLTSGFKHYIGLMFDKTTIFFGILFGSILTTIKMMPTTILDAIGYPKGVLAFILTLVVIDTATKFCAIIIDGYGQITVKNFRKAWSTDKISSKNMKNGLGVKSFFYLIFLYMAHQASIHTEIIGGEYISNVLYSLLFIIESKSITENLRDCGYNGLNSLLKFFDNKENELINGKK